MRVVRTLACLLLVVGVSSGVHAQTLITTTLNGIASSSDTVLTVTSVTGIRPGQLAFMEGETMQIAGVGVTSLTVVRGFRGIPTAKGVGTTIYTGPPEFFSETDIASESCLPTRSRVPFINITNSKVWKCTASGTWQPIYFASTGGGTTTVVADLFLQHGDKLVGRNFANTLDRTIFDWGNTAQDELIVGDLAATTRLRSSLGTPTQLSNGDLWVDCAGTTPTRVCSVKVRDGGATRTIISVTY